LRDKTPDEDFVMKKLFAVTTAVLIFAGTTAAPAFAKHRKQHSRHHMSSQMPSARGGTVGLAPRGNNAELMGNNGNSGQGDNSLGNIKGGNLGAGK
jgi:hypothetical protein